MIVHRLSRHDAIDNKKTHQLSRHAVWKMWLQGSFLARAAPSGVMSCRHTTHVLSRAVSSSGEGQGKREFTSERSLGREAA